MMFGCVISVLAMTVYSMIKIARGTKKKMETVRMKNRAGQNWSACVQQTGTRVPSK